MNKQGKMQKIYGMGTEYNCGGAADWLYDGSGITSPKGQKNVKIFESDGSEGLSESGGKKKYYGSAVKGPKEKSTDGSKVQVQLRQKLQQMRRKVQKLQQQLIRQKKNFDRILSLSREDVTRLQEYQRISQVKIIQLEQQNNHLMRQSVSLHDEKKIIEDEIVIERQRHESELAMKESEWAQRVQRVSQEKKEKFKKEQAQLVSTFEAKIEAQRMSQYENSRKLGENMVLLSRANQALIREKKQLIDYHKKLTEQLQTSLQAGQAEVATLKNQIQLMVNRHHKELADLRQKHELALNQERAKVTQLVKKIELQEDVHANQINQHAQDHENTLEQMRQDFENLAREYEGKLTQKEQECQVFLFKLEEQKQTHTKEIERLIVCNQQQATKNIQELEKLIKDYEDKLSRKDELHLQHLASQLLELNLTHDKQTAILQQQHRNQLNQIKTHFQHVIAQCEAKINTKTLEYEENLRQVKSQKEKFDNRVEQIQQKLHQIKTAFCVEVSQQEYIKLYQELEQTQDQLDSLSEEHEVSLPAEKKRFFKPKKLRHNSIFSSISSTTSLGISRTVNVQSSIKQRHKAPSENAASSGPGFEFFLKLGIY